MADDRALDGGWVAGELAAVLVQALRRLADLLQRPEGVPHVRVPGHDAHDPVPTHAADDDRQPPLDRARPGEHPLHAVEAAVVVDRLAVQQPADEHGRFLQAVHPLAHVGTEVEPVGTMLALVVTGSQPQDRPGPRTRGRASRPSWPSGPGCGTWSRTRARRWSAGWSPWPARTPMSTPRILSRAGPLDRAADDRRSRASRTRRAPPRAQRPAAGPRRRMHPEHGAEPHAWLRRCGVLDLRRPGVGSAIDPARVHRRARHRRRRRAPPSSTSHRRDPGRPRTRRRTRRPAPGGVHRRRPQEPARGPRPAARRQRRPHPASPAVTTTSRRRTRCRAPVRQLGGRAVDAGDRAASCSLGTTMSASRSSSSSMPSAGAGLSIVRTPAARAIAERLRDRSRAGIPASRSMHRRALDRVRDPRTTGSSRRC